MLVKGKGKISVHSLTKGEYEENKGYFDLMFDDILDSNDLFAGRNWDSAEGRFFEQHPDNSFVVLKVNNKIVGIMYSAPHRDYMCYDEYGTDNLDNWGIIYLIIHKDYQKKGYGTMLFDTGIQDMKDKGAKTVATMPNRKSIHILHNCIQEKGIGEMSRINDYQLILEMKFNEEFLSGKINLVDRDDLLVKQPKREHPYDLFDYYFFPYRLEMGD